VGKSIHARDLVLPKGVESTLHKGENPVVATCILPALITEEEEAAAAAATPAAGEVPAIAQAVPEEGAEAAAGEKGKPGEKAAEKGADKGADKADKKEKK
jgi:hypothetical protein